MQHPLCTVAILIVAGSRDQYLDLELLGELVDRHPCAHLEVWAEEGHELRLAQPVRCLALIERFTVGPS
jgi:hypothetical protein